jgi:hypothetical protein
MLLRQNCVRFYLKTVYALTTQLHVLCCENRVPVSFKSVKGSLSLPVVFDAILVSAHPLYS